MTSSDPGHRSHADTGLDMSILERVDRILLGSAVGVWLAALGAGVAATVALVNLARGHNDSGDSGTPWILYVVIVVSAVVIVGAVPLLLRARRAAQETGARQPGADPRVPQGAVPLRAKVTDAPTEKFRAPSTVSAGPAAAASGPLPQMLQPPPGAVVSPELEKLWLRCTVAILVAMGVATLLVGVSTYLMVVNTDVVAWVTYGLAGLVTLGMVALPWYFLREMRTEIEPMR